jgi:hypothetical protein
MTKRMPFEDYLKVEGTNWSTLKAMRVSALHYKYALAHDRPDTATLAAGRAGHTAVLEPMRFLREYALFEGARRAGKEWEAFKALHDGKTILKVDEYERAVALAAAVRAHPVAAEYLREGDAEVPIRWSDEVHGIPCKGRIDFVSRSKPALVDLKTTNDICERRFMSNAARFGHHCQLAFYQDGWFREHGESLPAVIIAVEAKAPHDVGVFHLSDDDLFVGQEEYRELLARVKEARRTNVWPGQYPSEIVPKLPRWAYGEEDATELDELTGWKNAG